jgi:hypothetical protein
MISHYVRSLSHVNYGLFSEINPKSGLERGREMVQNVLYPNSTFERDSKRVWVREIV